MNNKTIKAALDSDLLLYQSYQDESAVNVRRCYDNCMKQMPSHWKKQKSYDFFITYYAALDIFNFFIFTK